MPSGVLLASSRARGPAQNSAAADEGWPCCALAVRVVSMAIIIKIAASGDGLTICGSPHIIPSGPLYLPTGRGGMTPLDADLPRKGPKVLNWMAWQIREYRGCSSQSAS